MNRLKGCLAVVALMLAAPPEASAAEPTERVYTEAEKQEADHRFHEGRKLYEQGKLDEARVKFIQAYGVLRKPAMLWNEAVAEYYLKMYVDAVRHFKEHETLPGADPSDIQRARKEFIPFAEQQVGRVKIEAPAGTRVLIDGEQQPGAAPFPDPLYVSPGAHKIGAKGSDKRVDITVAAGAITTATLEGGAGTPGTAPGTEPAGPQPPNTPPANEQPTTYVYKPGRVPVTIGLGVVAVGALAAGVVFSLDAQSNADDGNAVRASLPAGACSQAVPDPRCATLRDKIDGTDSSNSLSTIFYIVSGVSAAGAIAAWYFWPKKPAPSAATWVVPSAHPNGGGLNVIGRF
jgi:hypothetical protein